MSVERHYERLLFRARADKARAEFRADVMEDFVRGLADGSLSWVDADRAARALVEQLDETESGEGDKRGDNRTVCDTSPNRSSCCTPLSEGVSECACCGSRSDLADSGTQEGCRCGKHRGPSLLPPIRP